MIHVLRIAHLSIAPQEGNLEVGNCEGIPSVVCVMLPLKDALVAYCCLSSR